MKNPIEMEWSDWLRTLAIFLIRIFSSEWRIIPMKKLQNYYLTCDKNLFFCDFFRRASGAPPTYDMIEDEIEAESTTSAHFSISHQFEPASAQVTSDTAFTMSSPPTWRNINWRHSQSDFFRKNLWNGGVNCCKNAEIWLAEKISIFWSDFPSESKLTTLIHACIFWGYSVDTFWEDNLAIFDHKMYA
jgi:hypothetical protein